MSAIRKLGNYIEINFQKKQLIGSCVELINRIYCEKNN
jgi:hypothetical protein